MAEYEKTPSFRATPLDSPITAHAVVVAADDGETIYAWGTGIFVARQFVITAKHVVLSFWDAIAQRPHPAKAAKCDFQIHVLQFPGSQAVPALWAVRRAWMAPATDAAFLHVVPNSPAAEQHAWRGTLELSPLPPNIGERIVGFGYPSSAARPIARQPLQQINWDLRPRTTVGKVTAIFDEQRDRVLLTFPCFETNARFDGGMSGGPVFNAAGQLCGLICAAVQTDNDGPFTSHAATLWPALLTTVDFEGPGIECGGPYGVWELSKIDYLRVRSWGDVLQRVFVERDEDGRERPRLRAPTGPREPRGQETGRE